MNASPTKWHFDEIKFPCVFVADISVWMYGANEIAGAECRYLCGCILLMQLHVQWYMSNLPLIPVAHDYHDDIFQAQIIV